MLVLWNDVYLINLWRQMTFQTRHCIVWHGKSTTWHMHATNLLRTLRAMKKETTYVILKLKYFCERHRLLILRIFWHGKRMAGQKPSSREREFRVTIYLLKIFSFLDGTWCFFSSLSVWRFVQNSMKSLWKISFNLIARQRTDTIFIFSNSSIFSNDISCYLSLVILYLWKLLILRLRNSLKLINW